MTQRILVLMVAAMAGLGAQDKGSENANAVVITLVPPAGQGGPDGTARIGGRVTIKCDECRIILFARGGDTWWVQPLTDSVYTEVVDGKWENETHLGSEYAALLVKPNYTPPAKAVVLPRRDPGIIAVTIVAGSK